MLQFYSTKHHHQRYSIIEAVVHLVNRDFVSLAELYRRMGFIPMEIDTAPIVLALEDALPDVLNSAVGGWNVLVIYCWAVLLYLYLFLFVC
jgi:predicted unusual protein kinase regulating ubiquinone biosynthesis (AarF/ABC1/UbiB family)